MIIMEEYIIYAIINIISRCILYLHMNSVMYTYLLDLEKAYRAKRKFEADGPLKVSKKKKPTREEKRKLMVTHNPSD